MIADDLLARVDSYLRRTGTTERAFGLAVARNHKLLGRVRAGTVTARTLDDVASFMDRHPNGLPPRDTHDEGIAA